MSRVAPAAPPPRGCGHSGPTTARIRAGFPVRFPAPDVFPALGENPPARVTLGSASGTIMQARSLRDHPMPEPNTLTGAPDGPNPPPQSTAGWVQAPEPGSEVAA